MPLGSSLRSWLDLNLKQIFAPNFLWTILVGTGVVGAVGYYAHHPIPVFWTPLAMTATALFVMWAYSRKEAKRIARKPIESSAEHFGVKWLYSTLDGNPVGWHPVPVCPLCQTPINLPQRPVTFYDQSIPRSDILHCIRDGCKFSVPFFGYEDDAMDKANRLIRGDCWRVQAS